MVGTACFLLFKMHLAEGKSTEKSRTAVNGHDQQKRQPETDKVGKLHRPSK